MKYDYETNLGNAIAELLNLKFDKEGKTNTSWGTKTRKGLGASIKRLVEEQDNKAIEESRLAENQENFDMGIITKQEFENQVNRIIISNFKS